MSLLSSHTIDSAQGLLDYEVVDQSGDNIGTLHSLWADTQTGQPEFVGVKTGWIFGQNHVVPVDKLEVDDANRTVRIPYTSEFIKGAMSIDADSTISDAQEAEIYRYFQLKGQSGHSAKAMSESDYEATSTTRTAGLGAAATGLTAAETTSVSSASTTAPAAAAKSVTGKDDVELSLSEEQVKVGKRTVDAGAVRLRKIVRTEVVNQPVEVQREDFVVERVSADQVHSGTATSNFNEEVIDVPLSREEVVVAKEAHVTGGVRLHKTAEVETQNVSETVRKEDVEVLRDGKTVTETHEVQK